MYPCLYAHVYYSTIYNSQGMALDAHQCVYVSKKNSFIHPSGKNEVTLFAGKLVELEMVVLSKIIQLYKDKYHIFSPA
jgi:hypothetical protein